MQLNSSVDCALVALLAVYCLRGRLSGGAAPRNSPPPFFSRVSIAVSIHCPERRVLGDTTDFD